MKKSFKIANRPLAGAKIEEADSKAQIVGEASSAETEPEKKSLPNGELQTKNIATPLIVTAPVTVRQSTTRKTIEVPEEYFHMVKMRAVERRIREKDLWAEILAEYFTNHPTT